MNEEIAAALEALHADAFGWALHCCDGDFSQAQDVLQTAYLKLVEGRAVFSNFSRIKTWWFGVIRNTAREEMRRRRQRESLICRFRRGTDSISPLSSVYSPAHQTEIDEEAARLRAAMRRLPGRQAEILHLVFYQDLSLSSAAAVLGISTGTARQHYQRGKARLRSLLDTPVSTSSNDDRPR